MRACCRHGPAGDGRALRWCAAGMVEAEKRFHKVNGFLHLPALRTALDDYAERGVTPIEYNKKDAA
jgi:putative transposase